MEDLGLKNYANEDGMTVFECDRETFPQDLDRVMKARIGTRWIIETVLLVGVAKVQITTDRPHD